MLSRTRHAIRFGLHQLTITLGIALFPIILAARQAGIPIPIAISRLVRATGAASDAAK
ncbi:hypothetical protein SAMN05192561_101743 [Halopenitus malekzadehii]|uniref:Uncharacterized protein n=1 Tax=Halopenitus malekzadehii TaxID=1267564 RepID=A0A1H6HYF8_9EURY|nr:hypothetical protein [Halopenitus malekzadehii]SEH41157.1 hypothetical protein SAMN05192561_101743 [Halopenitus malekzadehii]